jgi:hypothetical protein
MAYIKPRGMIDQQVLATDTPYTVKPVYMNLTEKMTLYLPSL